MTIARACFQLSSSHVSTTCSQSPVTTEDINCTAPHHARTPHTAGHHYSQLRGMRILNMRDGQQVGVIERPKCDNPCFQNNRGRREWCQPNGDQINDKSPLVSAKHIVSAKTNLHAFFFSFFLFHVLFNTLSSDDLQPQAVMPTEDITTTLHPQHMPIPMHTVCHSQLIYCFH